MQVKTNPFTRDVIEKPKQFWEKGKTLLTYKKIYFLSTSL